MSEKVDCIISLPEEVKDMVIAFAKVEDCTQSELVEKALLEYFVARGYDTLSVK